MKRVISLILVIIVFSSSFLLSFKKTETKPVAESKLQVDISASSAVLMEANTGEILYSKNEKEALPPASVTKIMTLLLACEALHAGKFNLEDNI